MPRGGLSSRVDPNLLHLFGHCKVTYFINASAYGFVIAFINVGFYVFVCYSKGTPSLFTDETKAKRKWFANRAGVAKNGMHLIC